MGNKRASKRMTARRAATFLATLGALVMSSGIALVATATSANAVHNEGHDPKIVVCKYVSTPGESDLQGGGNPVEPNLSSLKNAFDTDDWAAWLENPTFPKAWGDAQGQSGGSIAIGFAGEGLDITDCPGYEPETVLATATVTPVQPSCENDNVASYTTGGANVSFSESAAPAPGASITVTATATGDAEFEGGGTTQDFPLVFNAAEADCDRVIVDPPGGETPTVIVDPPADKTPTVTPTVVSAGLGEVSSDLRGEQGLALIFAGMVLMVAAGGLGLRGRTSRI